MTDIKKIDEEPVEVPSTDNLAAAQQVAEETATEIVAEENEEKVDNAVEATEEKTEAVEPAEDEAPVAKEPTEPETEAQDKEETPAEPAEEEKNYVVYETKEEVIARLKELAEGDEDVSRQERDHLKASFYKIHKQNAEAEYKNYIEQQAREQLHMIKPGEILYLLPEHDDEE